ncbi:hypothetical protein [Acinetobacter soli]|uniref:hypothetical protein n=1 Tax=Acinetobacter soli TaxID=487316 RepID=UPI001250C9A2|nr:hypothetical protein [Acinetobacter soli]
MFMFGLINLYSIILFFSIGPTWDWLGKNSGQIQIIIAVVAFWLAYKGYIEVLKQIKMAEDQSKASEEQTKQYAMQVKEAAKQTQIASKHFENSNIQIQELIDHRNIILDIRNGELKRDCIDMCIKAILSIQETDIVLTRCISMCNGRKKILDFSNNQDIEDWLDLNIERANSELEELRIKTKDLIKISGIFAKNDNNITNQEIQEKLGVTQLIYLRSIRTKYTFEELILGVEKKLPISNF